MKNTDLVEYRKKLQLSQVEFSEIYHIPKKTIQNWEQGVKLPPEYVFELLEERLKRDLIELDMIEEARKKYYGD